MNIKNQTLYTKSSIPSFPWNQEIQNLKSITIYVLSKTKPSAVVQKFADTTVNVVLMLFLTTMSRP